MCQSLYIPSLSVYLFCWADSEAPRLMDLHAHSGPARCTPPTPQSVCTEKLLVLGLQSPPLPVFEVWKGDLGRERLLRVRVCDRELPKGTDLLGVGGAGSTVSPSPSGFLHCLLINPETSVPVSSLMHFPAALSRLPPSVWLLLSKVDINC